eukprot:PhF_6_TR1483/c0_g1_i2/m.2675
MSLVESLKAEIREKDHLLFTQNERLCTMEALLDSMKRELDEMRGRNHDNVPDTRERCRILEETLEQKETQIALLEDERNQRKRESMKAARSVSPLRSPKSPVRTTSPKSSQSSHVPTTATVPVSIPKSVPAYTINAQAYQTKCESSWQKFVSVCRGEFTPEELGLVSLPTLKALMAHYKINRSPIDVAQIEAQWALLQEGKTRVEGTATFTQPPRKGRVPLAFPDHPKDFQLSVSDPKGPHLSHRPSREHVGLVTPRESAQPYCVKTGYMKNRSATPTQELRGIRVSAATRSRSTPGVEQSTTGTHKSRVKDYPLPSPTRKESIKAVKQKISPSSSGYGLKKVTQNIAPAPSHEQGLRTFNTKFQGALVASVPANPHRSHLVPPPPPPTANERAAAFQKMRDNMKKKEK